MLNFQKLTPENKEAYEALLFSGKERGCEYTFANLYLWGRQLCAFTQEGAALFSHFYGKSVYPFPVGPGNKLDLVTALREDARQRGIPFRMTGLLESEARRMEEAFPDQFYIWPDRNSFDYVYDINDLADLKGRKYQKKRNHANRFHAGHPNAQTQPLNSCNLPMVLQMVNDWYLNRMRQDPQGNYLLENIALAKAFRHYEELGMEGLVLMEEGQVLAVTLASRLSDNTFDVHFEKAREDIDGAYPVINQEFARYLRNAHPEVQFLNREDDLGLEGLRKAKLSYSPHHMVEKYQLCCREDLHED